MLRATFDDEDFRLEMLGKPEDLCTEMAIVIEHFTSRILERTVDPVDAAVKIAMLFTTAIDSAVHKTKEAES